MSEHSPGEALDKHFLHLARALRPTVAAACRGPSIRPSRCSRVSSSLRAGASAVDVQIGNRHLDLAARYLRAPGQGFFTVGSSGYEASAAAVGVVRATDPALLDYRSGAFYRPVPSRYAVPIRCATSCPAWSLRSRSRLPAVGTRSSATPLAVTRRPRPSSPTCHARWESPSPSTAPRSSASPRDDQPARLPTRRGPPAWLSRLGRRAPAGTVPCDRARSLRCSRAAACPTAHSTLSSPTGHQLRRRRR